MNNIFERMRGGLIVSCQAKPGSPLEGPILMAAMAESAEQGGAVGIRANGVDDIAAIKRTVSLPIIGILKRRDMGGDVDVWITPDPRSAKTVIQAGADIVAIDATHRKHPDGSSFQRTLATIRESYKVLVMADVATLDEGLAAAAAGADIVATTLSGYTPYSPHLQDPDFKLIQALATQLSIPVIAEGRIVSPEQAQQAIELGAFAVVVGQAITDPFSTTARFVASIRRAKKPTG